jgi:chromosome segregation ATPase
LFNESVKKLKGFITILKKRLNLVKEIIKKINARLSNKIAYLRESLSDIKNDIITIKEKISGIITDRDHVIIALARIVNSEFKSGYSA